MVEGHTSQRAIASCLYDGRVTHRRLIPFRHDLAYNVYSLFLDLVEAPSFDKGGWWFGYNRKALLSFYERDHGGRDGSNLLEWVRGQLASAGIKDSGFQISLLCFPRVIGYVFNPLSVYFCRNEQGRLGAILYEVKNTFGDQHCYLFPIADSAASPYEHGCAKEFYVSPFIQMKAEYAFSVSEPREHFHLFIRQSVPEGELLQASWKGQRRPWSEKELRRSFWIYPLLTFKIIFGIHWQALKIWGKKAKFIGRPAPPEHPVSVIKPLVK